MMTFKNHNRPGMTFVEVVLAVGIASFLSLGALTLQSTLLELVSRSKQYITHMIMLGSGIAKLHKEELEGSKASVADIKSEEKKLETTGSFKDLKDLQKLSYTIEWQGIFGKKSEQLVYLAYKKKESKQP